MGKKKWVKQSSDEKIKTYQKDAIQEWNQNNCRGILEHATGSKTFTALNAKKTFTKIGLLL